MGKAPGSFESAHGEPGIAYIDPISADVTDQFGNGLGKVDIVAPATVSASYYGAEHAAIDAVHHEMGPGAVKVASPLVKEIQAASLAAIAAVEVEMSDEAFYADLEENGLAVNFPDEEGEADEPVDSSETDNDESAADTAHYFLSSLGKLTLSDIELSDESEEDSDAPEEESDEPTPNPETLLGWIMLSTTEPYENTEDEYADLEQPTESPESTTEELPYRLGAFSVMLSMETETALEDEVAPDLSVLTDEDLEFLRDAALEQQRDLDEALTNLGQEYSVAF